MTLKSFLSMFIKIQNCSPGSPGNKNTGSCGALAEYLEHEDEERLAEGKDKIPFMTPDGVPVSKGEVIDKIDRNHKHLGKTDTKFFHISVDPSPDEIKAMGETEQEQYRGGIKLARLISDAYAENFNREEVRTADDLTIYWKIHYTRGDEDELQFHMHGVVSRNSDGRAGKVVKISPMTPHKNTEAGPVKGGFNKKLFYLKCEKLFDKLFHYDRKVSESFDYKNAQEHGSPTEKAEQAKRLAEEQSAEMELAIKAGIERRRKSLKDKNDIAELAEALKSENGISAIKNDNPIVNAIETADIKAKVMRVLEQAKPVGSLEIALMAIGAFCEPILTEAGAVRDISINYCGRTILASTITNPYEHKAIIYNWCRCTGMKPEASSIKESIRRVEQVVPPKKKIGHHF